jgi:hypothetical protein
MYLMSAVLYQQRLHSCVVFSCEFVEFNSGSIEKFIYDSISVMEGHLQAPLRKCLLGINVVLIHNTKFEFSPTRFTERYNGILYIKVSDDRAQH